MKLAPRVISLFLSRQRNRECRCSSVFRLCSPTVLRFASTRRDERSPIKTRRCRACFSRIETFPFSCFSRRVSLHLFLLSSFIFYAAFSVSRLSPTIRASIYQTSSGEASDNRFNRWTVKEIAASPSPSHLARAPSHNVKSTESL